MLYRKKIAVFFLTSTQKTKKQLFLQNVELLSVKLAVHIVTIGL